MPDQLPPPVTTAARESLIDWRRIGFVQTIKTQWTRFRRDRNTGSSTSMPGGSIDASDTHPSGQESISQIPRDKDDLEDYRQRKDAYYAIPFHQGRQRKRREDGDESFLQLTAKKAKPIPIDAGGPAETEEEIGEVDEVVVDNSFEVGAPQESLTEPSGGVEQLPNVSMQPGQGKPGMAFGWDPKDKHDGVTQNSSNNQSQRETSSFAYTGQSTFRFLKPSHWFSSLNHFLVGVFQPRFDDEELERRFKSQEWHSSKMLALVSSGFLVLNWVLACALVPQPWVDFDKAFHYGVATLLTAPLPIFILLHWPLTRPTFYQIYLTCSLWCWTLWYLFSMYLCDYYGNPRQGVFSCGSKDFLGNFYFIIGMPVLGLFALGQWRLPAALAATTHIILLGALIVPKRHSLGRLLANEICYQFFLLYISWKREMIDRDRFIMSRQIKDAYLYRHRLQMKEKQIQTSKQRLTSYIFHEVRVPLNTAMLAVQNIEASGIIEKPLALEFNALSGSLTVMSKVLNDVLDLNRMDAGKFESVAKPYSFHKVLDSLMVPLRMAAAAKQLQLIEDLDPEIDKYALAAYKAALKAKHTNSEEVDDSELEPWVVGDEMRLRQVFTNLSSNAVKFSQPGGRIEIVTRLLYPCPPGCGPVPPLTPGEFGAEIQVGRNETAGVAVHGTSTAPAVKAPSLPIPVPVMRPQFVRKSSARGRSVAEKRLSSSNVPQVGAPINEKTGSTSVPLAIPLDQIVVRIEVRDAGVGIKLQDARDARLFSPYVQTEIGRYQGGKGTGLGLALVRRIVKLSGGRLGVKSKFNQGSCFWVELPLGVGGRAIQTSSSDGTGRGISVRSIPMPVSTTRDFGLPFPDLDEVPSERCGQETPSRAPTLNVAPPTAHFTHRTIMEQQGLVEMTPSRPELRWERKSREDRSYSEEQPRAVPPAFLSEADFGTPVIKPGPLSEPGGGTSARASALMGTMTTTNLPATPINPPISEPPSSPERKLLSVLVVDDDQLTRKLMTRMLNRLGCVVTTAEHGAVALEMLLGSVDTPYETTENSGLAPLPPGTMMNHQGPSKPRFWDLVLLDNQMPKMSGLEAIARLRAAQRDDLVVGVTGNALIRDQDEYLGAGVDHVLIKPVQERSIKQMLALAEERQNNPSRHPPANG